MSQSFQERIATAAARRESQGPAARRPGRAVASAARSLGFSVDSTAGCNSAHSSASGGLENERGPGGGLAQSGPSRLEPSEALTPVCSPLPGQGDGLGHDFVQAPGRRHDTAPDAPLARIERQVGALVALVADLAQILRNRVAEGDSGCPVCAPVNAESPNPAAAAEATPAPPRLLSVPQVATHLGVNSKTVRRWREAGVLPPPIQLGGIIRWRAEDLDAFLAERAEQRRGA